VFTDPSGSGASGATQGGGGNSVGGEGAGSNCLTDPSPCTLVEQCGCDGGDKCTIDGDTPECVGNGSVNAGELCDVDDCKAGSICVPKSGGDPKLCKKFCDSHADCEGAGSFCTIQIEGSGDETVATACTMDCDPLGGNLSGCPAPNTKCIIRRANPEGTQWGTDCVATGDAQVFEACNSSEDCGLGLVCTANMPGACIALCDPSAMPDTCPVMTNCNAFMPTISIGGVTYGACF
jgi:hypothetical protein